MAVQGCGFLAHFQHQLGAMFTDCNPFTPSDSNLREREDTRRGSYNGSPTYIFVERRRSWCESPLSWGFFHRYQRPPTVVVQASSNESETETAARRRRQEEEAQWNRTIAVVTGLLTLPFCYVMVKVYAAYRLAQDSLQELNDRWEGIKIDGQLEGNDLEAWNQCLEVVQAFSAVHREKIQKLRGYVVLSTALFAEMTTLCLSAFYRNSRLRDAAGVACFLTTLAGVGFYAMYGSTGARSIPKSLEEKINAIRSAITQSQGYISPPSYAEATNQRVATAPDQWGNVSTVNSISYIQHNVTGQWFLNYPGSNEWHATAYPPSFQA